MRKRKKLTGEQRQQFVGKMAEKLAEQKEREAGCRRKLLAGLSPAAAEFTRREFAKLGLTQ